MISSVKTLSETAQTQQQIARNIAEQAKCIQDILNGQPSLSSNVRISLENMVDDLAESAKSLSNNAVKTAETIYTIVKNRSN